LPDQVLDAAWGDFLEDLAAVETAVTLRQFSHLDPLDELRLETSARAILLACPDCKSLHMSSVLQQDCTHAIRHMHAISLRSFYLPACMQLARKTITSQHLQPGLLCRARRALVGSLMHAGSVS
jgi:hypothetical protein